MRFPERVVVLYIFHYSTIPMQIIFVHL